MQFDARDISRSSLIRKDVEQASVNEKPFKADEVQLGESLMSGNERTSYQTIGPIRLVIRHIRPIDVEQSGNRSRYIKSIFFHNADGEKFKSPYNNLTISRALANHLAQGGHVHDENYKNICNLAESMSKIKGFLRRSIYENYQDPEIVSLVSEAKKEFLEGKKLFKKIASAKGYSQALIELKDKLSINSTDEDVDYLRQKFTKSMINDKIENALPNISAIYHKKNQKNKVLIDQKKWLFDKKLINRVAENIAMYDNTIKYNNIDQMVENILENLSLILKEQDRHDLAEESNNWAENYTQLENLIEKQLISKFVVEVLKSAKELKSNPKTISEDTTNTDEELDLEELQNILNSPIEFGVDGDNIIGALSNIISDDELNDLLYQESKDNPDEDARPMLKYWLLDNYPEVHDQLDFSKLEDKNVIPPAPIEPPPPPAPPPPPPVQEPMGTVPAMEPAPQALPQALPQAQPAPQEIQDLQRLSGIR